MSFTLLNVSSFEGPTASFIIPYDTVSSVSTELLNVSVGLDRVKAQMASALLSTLFVTMHTICAGYAAKIQIARGLKGPRRTLFCVTTAMYISTFVCSITLVVGQFKTLHNIKNSLSNAYNWLPPSECFSWRPIDTLPEYCTMLLSPDLSPSDLGWASTEECVGTVTLTFNVILGDAIVWWRVWVLWHRRRGILVVCCLVLLATLAFAALDSAISCSGPVLPNAFGRLFENVTTTGEFFGGNRFGTCAIALSLFSNGVTTLLVGYKFWRHALRRKTILGSTRVLGAAPAHRALMVLVESGVAYCLLWAFVLLSEVSWTHSSTGLSAWSNEMLYFTEGCLVALVAIYPMLIIVLVALDKSEIDRQLSAQSPPCSDMPSVARALALEPSPTQADVATNDVSRVAGPTRPASVGLR